MAGCKVVLETIERVKLGMKELGGGVIELAGSLLGSPENAVKLALLAVVLAVSLFLLAVLVSMFGGVSIVFFVVGAACVPLLNKIWS